MIHCFDIEDINTEADALVVAKELRNEVIQVVNHVGRGKSQRIKACQSKIQQFCALCNDEKWGESNKAILKSIDRIEEAGKEYVTNLYYL